MRFYSIKSMLDNASVADIVDGMTAAYMDIAGKSAMPKTRFRIAFEELLLQYRDFYGADKECTIKGEKIRGKYVFEIISEGPRRDWMPFDGELVMSYNILKRVNVTPRYAYSNMGGGKNRVIWEVLPQKYGRSTIVLTFAALVLAVIVGLIICSLPQETHESIVKAIFSPFFNKFIFILSELATPLVFFAVIDGIAGMGDVKAFGSVGSKVLVRMLISYLIAMVLFMAIGIPIYGVSAASDTQAGGSIEASGQVITLVLDIIPNNMLMPFTTDNDLQVIAIAIFIGVALLLLGDRVQRILNFIRDCSVLINKMMSICCKLLPAIVFFGVTNMICASNVSQLASIGKMFLVFVLGGLVFTAIMIIRTATVMKTPLKYILPKQMPTLMINITTSSQVAALPENMRCCKEGFGIDHKLVDFGLPLGIVTYMPNGAIFLGVSAWALCLAFNVPVTISLMLRILFISMIIAIAAPPIPGSAIVVMPIFFATCGIPNEAFPIAIVFGTVVGYFLPALNGFALQLEMLMTAKKLNKVDENVLRGSYAADDA